jgi:endoglucanase
VIRRLLLPVTLASALLGAGAACAAAPDPAGPAPSGGIASEKAADAFSTGWAGYRQRFVKPEGRVLDDGNANVSHSESQGYGMLLAVLADDPFTFAKIWGWTQKELMIRPDGLAAWRWEPDKSPHVQDMNNASDGDLLIAWALAEAGARWKKPDYAEAAGRVGAALVAAAVKPVNGAPALLPGAVGFTATDRADGPVLNPSYSVFPAFEALARLMPEAGWQALRRSGLKLVEKARFGPLKLPSDWMSAAEPKLRPAAGFKPEFGYNAVRIPLYLAMSRELPAPALREAVSPFAGLWAEDGDVGPFVIDVATGSAAEPFYGRGYKAVMALARCIRTGARLPPALLGPAPADQYYPATLHLLTLHVISERYPACV